MKKVIVMACILLYFFNVEGQVTLPPVINDKNKEIRTNTPPDSFNVDLFNTELAYRWAPIHYQDTDNSYAKADYITKFDYDNNWIGTDNWENLNVGSLDAYVYYSVVETSTNWFIVYAFYHPRDWTDHSFDQEHENDMEGIMSVIKKDGSEFGAMEAMITVAHYHFYSFVPDGSALTSGHEDIDGQVTFENYDHAMHPKTFEEAKGHPIKAYPFVGNFSGQANEDGIIYYPSKTTAGLPESGNDRSVNYQLIDLTAFGSLWTLQILESTQTYEKSKTYASWGTFKGDKGGGCGDGVTVLCATNAANTPWGWDEKDDGPFYPGALAFDPAGLVNYYFSGLGSFSLKYTRNKYIQELKAQGFNDQFLPRGWTDLWMLSDLFTKL